MAEILCLLYWLTAAPLQREVGGQHLHLAVSAVDKQKSHLIGLPLVVDHSIWQDRFRHCLVHHLLAEEWCPI